MTEADERRIRQSLAQILETSNLSRREIAGQAGIDNSQLGRFLNEDAGLSDERLSKLQEVIDRHQRASSPESVIPAASLHELACALRDGSLTLLVGAGLSRQALPPPGKKPLPLWGELATGLAREIVGEPAVEGLKDLSPLDQLDYLQALGHRGKVERLLREQFLNDDRYRPSPAHEALAKLPWKTVLTTNYDSLLGQVLDVRFPVVTERDFNSHDSRTMRLVHLNGDLREPHTLFTDDFHGWAERHPRAHAFLQEVVSPPNRVLFVGYSFSDPFLVELLARVRQLSSREGFQNVIHAWMWRLEAPKKLILRSRYNVEAQIIHHDGEWQRAFEELLAAYEKLGGPSARPAKPSASPELRRRFYEIQCHAHARANLSGLYVGEAYRADDVLLEHVFVQPSLCLLHEEKPRPRQSGKDQDGDLDPAIFAEEEHRGARSCLPAMQWLEAPQSPRLVILGDPGTGKTSLLQTRLLACLQQWVADPTSTFPVFLRLSIWEKDCAPHKSLIDYAVEVIAAQIGIADAELLRPWLTTGPVHWLLDGVDEVRDPIRRKTLLGRLDLLQRDHPQHRWTVTSRPSGYRDSRMPPTWKHLELAPLDNIQGLALLANWADLLQKLHKLPRRYYEPEELFADLGDQPGLSPLRRNPLLLTMIVLFYRDSYRLPKDRWEFYTHAAQSLRMRWARHRSGLPDGSVGKLVEMRYFESLLPHLAIEAMKRHTAVFSRTQLRDMLETVLKWNDFTGRAIDEEIFSFFNDAIALIGVFVEKGLDRFGFLHLTFQEYYAAAWLIAHETEAEELMHRHGLDPDWKEVWELYVLGQGINGDKLDALHKAVGGNLEALEVRLRWLGLGSAPFPESGPRHEVRKYAVGALDYKESPKESSKALAVLARWERSYPPDILKGLQRLLDVRDNERCHLASKALGEHTEGRELRMELLKMFCGSNDRLRGFAELALSMKADSPRVSKDLLALYHGAAPEGWTGGEVSVLARAAAARALGGRVPAVELWGEPPMEKRVVQLTPEIAMTFLRIPKGTLVGGEDLKHRVELTEDFWMAQTQVTQAQWQAVMGSNPSQFKGAHRPVETVSWLAIAADAETSFNQRLAQHPAYRAVFGDGSAVHLPTEAQWEYACRAGGQTAFHFGDSLGSHQANFNGNYPDGGAEVGSSRVDLQACKLEYSIVSPK